MSKIYIYPEFCCEDSKECDDIVHNHIDCPMCKKMYVETNFYAKLELNDLFKCENCDTEFVYIGNNEAKLKCF